MLWYEKTGKNPDTVISTRVRLARNVVSYPFEGKLNEEKANELIEKISESLLSGGFSKVDFSNLSSIESSSYVEKHLVSPEFAAKQTPHALFTEEKTGLSIMACEEDHLRIQCILPGLALDEAYENAHKAEQRLDESFEFAYSEKLGYLTHCPTNLGTGLRASVMMFLPALSMGGYMDSLVNQLSKIGLTVRGLFGEGSESAGNIYQISNQVTLGISEEETLSKLKDAIKQVMDSELKARKAITGEPLERLTDRICRSLGILRYAYRISSMEMMKLLSDIRLGISLGTINEVGYEDLTRLLVEGMPATLTLEKKAKILNESDRDKIRALKIHQALNKQIDK